MELEERLKVLNDYYARCLASGMAHTKKQFAELVNVNNSSLSAAFNGDERYLTDTMILKVRNAIDKLELDAMFPSLKSGASIGNGVTIPVLPTSARAGSLADFAESVQAYQCEKIISPIKGVDYAMQITGDSMSPEYPNGSHILIKKIDPTAFIPYGNVLVLDTCNGAVIKQIFPTDKEDVIECRSLNPLYPSFKVKMEDVYGWYRVLMCLSLK